MPSQGCGQRFKKLFLDYSQWCTIACLNKLASKIKWLAIVFAIVFVIMLVLFIYISITLVLKYFKFPSSTELTLDVQSEMFPRFSFCNENPLKRSVVDTDTAFVDIAKMLAQFEELEQGTRTTDDFGIGEGAKTSLRRRLRARMMLRLLMNKLSSADRIRGGYSYTDLVSECTFAGKTCTSSDFTSFLHPDYGVCFTFAIERNITRAGAQQALKMLLTVNVCFFCYGGISQKNSEICSKTRRHSTCSTFCPRLRALQCEFQLPKIHNLDDFSRAVVHQLEDYPDFMMNGFKIGVSTQASIAISKISHLRTDAPYGNCTTEAGDADNYYANYTYTLNTCQHSCLQRVAMEKCKCVDPLYKKASDHTYCSTPADMLCLVSLVKQDISSANGSAPICNCFPPCSETRLARTITYGIYPSAKYKVAAGTQSQREVLLDTQGGGRDGVPNEDADDYDHPNPATTTPSPICEPQDLMPYNDKLVKLDLVSAKCSSDHYEYFDTTKFIVIQGWPCLSPKPCQTCLMYAKPMAEWEWPCNYRKYEVCTQYNGNSTNTYECSKFFGLFDFIPTGVDSPNVKNWALGEGPGTGDCATKFNPGTPARAQCFEDNDCERIPALPDITILAQSSLIDSTFRASLNPGMNKCEFLDALAAAQQQHYYPDSNLISDILNDLGGGGRKKRATNADPSNSTSNTTVDTPGYGSCEYANKNFRGAAECIKWYRRNGLTFELYYGTLATNTYTQSPSYTLVTMLSDIAGHAGLWLGISVVSLVEIGALVVMMFSALICRRKKPASATDSMTEEVNNRKERKLTTEQE